MLIDTDAERASICIPYAQLIVSRAHSIDRPTVCVYENIFSGDGGHC